MTAKTLDKAKVRHSFSAAAAGYDGVAALQRNVGQALLRKFPPREMPGLLVDLGSGTGFLSRQLLASQRIEQIVAVDLALPMLEISRRKQPQAPIWHVCADAEQLPLLSGSVAQLYSNLAFQWLEDLHRAFCELRRVLQPRGRLVFTTFGPQTLQELKLAWAAVDDAVHVNSFADAAVIGQALLSAGFSGIDLQTEVHVCPYPTVMALMQELKGLGAHNVNNGRSRKPTTRRELTQMMQNYQQMMMGSLILASYEIVYVQAQA